MTIRVLIADDDTLVRVGLRMMIETAPDLSLVGEAGDGATAVALARELAPDVVLMDIRMPDMDGLEATRQIVAIPADDDATGARVIVVTTFEIDEYVYDAVRAGASGFLLKRTAPEDLLEGIRVVAAGEALLSPSVTRRLMAEFARTSAVRSTAAFAALTPREREVLILIAKGLTNSEIAAALFVAESTVKTHVKRILMKLDLRDRVHAVVAAYEAGLLAPGGN